MASRTAIRDILEQILITNQLNIMLKDKQMDCFEAVVNKKDTFAILPTGYGKTLIYMLLPSLLDKFHNTNTGHHIILVISPLVGLMQQQVENFIQSGLTAVALHSENPNFAG